MMADGQLPPPTASELMRGLDRVERSLDQLSNRVVTTQVWSVEQAHINHQIGDLKNGIADLKSLMTEKLAEHKVETDEKINAMKDETNKKSAQRWQVWLSIITASLSLLTALAVVWVGG